MPEGTDAVQPEGQGGGGLYDQVLSTVPENVRETVEPILKQWDQQVNPKLQEAAEYRKQWEPYETLNLNNVPVEELQELLAFREIAQNPDQFRDWYQQIGKQFDLLGEQEAVAEADDPKLSALEAQFQELAQWKQEQEMERAVQEAERFVQSEIESIRKEHKQLTDDDEKLICQLALAYDGQDAIKQGFKDFQALLSRAEKGLFEKKEQDPAAAVSGGLADTAPSPITGFGDARKAAMERLSQSR